MRSTTMGSPHQEEAKSSEQPSVACNKREEDREVVDDGAEVAEEDHGDDGKGDDELRARRHTTEVLLGAVLLRARSTGY